MLVWNLRRPGFRIVLAVVILLMVGVLTVRIDGGGTSEAAALIELTWGKGDGQVALTKSGRGTPPLGPESLAVTEDRLYVLDGANERVLCFARDGAAAGSLPLPKKTVGTPTDLAADAKGNLFVLTDKGVFRAGTEGPVNLELALPPASGEAVATNLWVDRDGAFYLRQMIVEDERYVQRLVRCGGKGDPETLSLAVLASDGNYTVDLEAVLPIEVNDLSFGPNGEYYIEGRTTDPFTRVYAVYSTKGDLIREIVIREEKYVRDSSLLGVDRHGDFVVGINLATSDAKLLRVSRTGKVLASWQPAPGTVRANVYGCVAASGDVYVARGTDDKCVIECCRTSRHLALRWAWQDPD
jgi:hypothetical protein